MKNTTQQKGTQMIYKIQQHTDGHFRTIAVVRSIPSAERRIRTLKKQGITNLVVVEASDRKGRQ